MPHLYVVAGHGDGDPGASGYNSNGQYYTEAERVRALAWRLKELGGDNVTLGNTNINWYYESHSWVGRGYYTLDIPNDWCVVELHMDSADSSSAKGAHVIVRGTPDSYDYALAEFISGMFPGRASTVVSRTDLQNPNVASSMGLNYRLVENGFISNSSDLDKYNANLTEIAKGYLQVFNIPIVTSDDTQKVEETTYMPSKTQSLYDCTVNTYNDAKSAFPNARLISAPYCWGAGIKVDETYDDSYSWNDLAEYDSVVGAWRCSGGEVLTNARLWIRGSLNSTDAIGSDRSETTPGMHPNTGGSKVIASYVAQGIRGTYTERDTNAIVKMGNNLGDCYACFDLSGNVVTMTWGGSCSSLKDKITMPGWAWPMQDVSGICYTFIDNTVSWHIVYAHKNGTLSIYGKDDKANLGSTGCTMVWNV